MSEKKTKQSDGFSPKDNDVNEDYYLDDIDEFDDDTCLDDELSEEDEDYFLDDGEDEAEKSSEAAGEVIGRDIFEEEDPQVANRKVRRKRKGKSKGKMEKNSGKIKTRGSTKAWIISGSVVAVLLLVYVGVSLFFENHFLPNTKINGRDFSAKKTTYVEAFLKEKVKDYELTVLEKDKKSDFVKGSDISLVYKESDAVEKELKKQNGFLWPAALFSEDSSEVNIKVSYDQSALENKVKSLQAVSAEQIAPESAHPEFDGEKFVVKPEVIGTAVDMDTLNKKVSQYITEFKPKLDMEKEKCYILPKYTSKSKEVQKACDIMNNYTKASITYNMTEPVVVDKALISTWLSVDDDMHVTFDENEVKAWLTDFGDTYDTVGITRSITTPTGKTAEVSGGTYGWSIDEDTEFTALTDSIKKGETVSKDPAYYQTAAEHSATDWGKTYAEVDLTTQHMWYIVDGAVSMESDVVTGVPIPEKETPAGVYDILEIQRDKTLIGETDPATGEPEYKTPVTFWMRITWTGVGFHNADWQPAFGGTLYQNPNVGSHGCINMPYDTAEVLFNSISVGTPVIMHY
ncbi:L,D-transpeptidase family protein [Clostridium sp. C105KSO13]|uniref:L,D-transpeptidase family protein n=1 Tax=Clostridium sp. C105KSO13 TaxID=1776045 RepID=UPI00074060D2|nr:L,D-transpeptidase family protein [Clostridium sp. C105KSO13]CUX49891.1 hypothetical protein BN3456_02888 [Clostridium sp. C105KSO13]